MNDLMALGVLKEMLREGRRVPDDVSVLGMDDLEFGNMVTPSLSSIRYPFKELVENAIKLLLRQIEEERLIDDTIVLEPSLTIKDSTGPVPSK